MRLHRLEDLEPGHPWTSEVRATKGRIVVLVHCVVKVDFQRFDDPSFPQTLEPVVIGFR
jgi:hypothetical protein